MAASIPPLAPVPQEPDQARRPGLGGQPDAGGPDWLPLAVAISPAEDELRQHHHPLDLRRRSSNIGPH